MDKKIPPLPFASTTDSYTASIELSNSCRAFYKNRLEATAAFKTRLESRGSQKLARKKTSIDISMEKLISEMAGLMDQDLNLMKQLLNLNEAIEELKFKRLHYVSTDSLCTASSDWSVSETDMFESEENLAAVKNESFLSCESSPDLPSSDRCDTRVVIDNKIEYILKIENKIESNENSIQIKHGGQSSIDSGYGENHINSDIEVQI